MATEEQKKGNTNIGGLVVVLIILIALIWLATSFSSSARNRVRAPAATAAPQTFSVVYSVIGTDTDAASLTIRNETGGTEQMDVRLPWSKRFDAESGQFVYLSAQNENDSGSIKCEILVNDARIQTAESDGAYAIASCSGSVD